METLPAGSSKNWLFGTTFQPSRWLVASSQKKIIQFGELFGPQRFNLQACNGLKRPAWAMNEVTPEFLKWKYIHMNTYKYIYIHIQTYTYIYIYIYIHTYTYIHTFIHTYILTYVLTYFTYIRTYIHTYITLHYITLHYIT